MSKQQKVVNNNGGIDAIQVVANTDSQSNGRDVTKSTDTLADPLLQEIGQTINEEKNAPKTAEQLAKNHQFWLAKQAE